MQLQVFFLYGAFNREGHLSQNPKYKFDLGIYYIYVQGI